MFARMLTQPWYIVTAMFLVFVLVPTMGTLPDMTPPAAADPKDGSAAVKPVTSRPDLVSAQVSSKAQGSRVEVEAARDESSTTYANPDGTLTTEAYSGPIRMRDSDDQWVDIDPTLEATDSGFESKATPQDLTVSDGGKEAFATVKFDGDEDTSFGLEWDGPLPTPQVSDNTAVYEDIDNAFGVAADLRVEADKESFSHSLILKDQPTIDGDEPVDIRLPLDLQGAEVTAEDDGRLVVKTDDGERVLTAPTPLMWDDEVDDASGEPANVAKVETKIEEKDGRAVLVLTPDPTFLTDPQRTYPVTIDPTFGASTDTWVDSQLKTSQRSSKELRVGTYDSGARKYRSYLKFNTSSLKNGKVVDAKLRMFNYYSSTCKGGQVIEAKRVTSAWDPAKITWDKQPSTTTSNMGTNTKALGYSSSCKGALVDFGMTKIVEAWTTGGQANHGLVVRARDESASTAWRRYRSANYVEGKQDNKTEPHLVVTWNRTPNVPTTPKILGSVTSGSETFTGDARPSFESTVKDPDGGTVKFDIEVKKDSGSGAAAGKCTSGYVQSGKKVKCKLDTDLANNGTYVVRTRSWDGKLNSAWSGWTKFKTALTAPTKPAIACPAPYAKGSWNDDLPKSDVTCTVTATGSGNSAPKTVEVDVDHKRTKITLSGNKATFKVSKKAGSHRIDARVYNVTGKASAWAGVYSFGYGKAGMTSPADGTVTTSTVKLNSSAPPKGTASSVTAKVFWRLAGSGEDDRGGWTESNAVTVKDNGESGMSVTGLWNTQSATQTADGTKLDPRKPALLDIQVCYIYTGVSTQCTWATGPTQVVRIAHAFGENFPTSEAGPGQVALWTGEFNTDVTDVSVPGYNGDLSLSRSHSTYAGATDDVRNIFGPGWTANLDGDDETGQAGMEVHDATLSEGVIALIDEEGEPLVFQQPSKKRIQTEKGTYTPIDEDTKASGIGLKVTGTGTGAKILVTDDEGVVTTFTPVAVATNKDTVWTPASVASPGKQGTTTFTKNAQGKITRILAGSAPGVDCPATGSLPKGCRALELTYASSTTATKTKSGDVAGQVKTLSYTGWNPETKAMETIPVAEYLYDGDKRLQTVTDPRSSLATSYTYTSVKNAIHPALGSVTPAGEKTWYLHYEEVDSSAKLTKITRDPLGSSGTPVTLGSFVYGIDPSTKTDGLPDMTADGVAAWGQEEAPTQGFAVFSADEPTSGGGAAGISKDKWASADLSYTDDSGRVTNTASYGAGQWLPTRTLFDDKDNIVAEWDTAGLSEAKASLADVEGFDASYYATVTRYNADSEDKNGELPVVAAGTVATDVWEPVATVVLPNGESAEARKHTHTNYDQGAPNGGYKPSETEDEDLKQKFLLPTTVTTGAASADAASSDTEVSLPDDLATISTIKSGYDPIDDASPTGATSGWMLGQPTTTTTVMDGGEDIVSKTRFDSAGGVVESRQPLSNGSDAGTTLSSYYTADGSGQCGNKPEWAGLLCETKPATAPSSGPALTTVTKAAYNVWLAPSREKEASGAVSRTTETTYLPDGRADTVSVSSEGLDTESLPVTKTVYDPDTGNAVGTQSLNGGDVTGSTSSEYDAWGRLVAYTNVQGDRTTTEYVAPGQAGAGEIAKTVSPVGTVTYGYNGTDVNGNEERRGLLTSQTVSGVGDFAAAYDHGGKLTRQTMPGGVEQTSSYDINGNQTGLTYSGAVTLDDESTETQSWLSWSMDSDISDRTVRERTPDGRSYEDEDATADLEYDYDQAGRLIKAVDRTGATAPVSSDESGGDEDDQIVEDPVATGTCVVRSYGFDRNSNRTSKNVQVADSGQDCGQGEKSAQSWTVDTADRVTTGYTYDGLGRVTKLPSTDAPKPDGGDISLGYYADDLPASISQGGSETVFTLDPEARRTGSSTTVADTTTMRERHYSDDSDNPAWVVEETGGQASTTRYESSIGGDLGITVEEDRTAVAVIDPHGDTVSSIVLPGSVDLASGIESWSAYDEYGIVHQRSTPTDTGAITYGWLGGKERATDESGLLLMGVRLYNPITGRFTAVDPEDGGSDAAYAYPTDPVNSFDLDGKRWRPKSRVGRFLWKYKWDIALTAAMFIPGVGAVAGGARLVSWGVRAFRVYRRIKRPVSRFRTFRGAAYVTRSRRTARAAGSFSRGSFRRSSSSFAYHYGKHGRRWKSAKRYGSGAAKHLRKVRGSSRRSHKGSPGGILNRSRNRWHSFW